MNMKRKKLRLLNKRVGPALSGVEGFILVELLVVVFIIVLLLSIAFGVLRLGIVTQRSAGENQVLLDQISLVAEYTSRQLRYAQQGDGSCATEHYEITGTLMPPRQGIKFLNAASECVHIYLDTAGSGIIYVKKDSDAPYALTSNDMEVTAFRFEADGMTGGDEKQPRVTFTIRAKPRQGIEDITIQNTISQRILDN